MGYLGKEVTPEIYYQKYATQYLNNQIDAIENILLQYSHFLDGPVLDLGCGSGLATTILKQNLEGPFLGLDTSQAMVERY